MAVFDEAQQMYLKRMENMIKRGLPQDVSLRELYNHLEMLTERFSVDNTPEHDQAAPFALDPRWSDLWDSIKHNPVFDTSSSISLRYAQKIDNLLQNHIKGPQIDRAISDLRLAPEDRITFLLGAGASAPAPSSIPTVANLLPELWRRARKVGRDDIDRLADWCNEREISNIEDLLTAAYIANFAAKNNALTQLIDYFFTGDRSSTTEGLHRVSSRLDSKVNVASIALIQDTLQRLFGLLASTMIPAQPNAGHDAIVNFVAKHKNTTIVTTNYDGCIDEAFLNHKVVLRTYLEERIHDDHEGLDLIKIHGSINWTYCDSCQEVKEFKLDKLKNSYEKDTLSYPVIGICRACGGQRRPLLVPPMGFKFIMFPNLIQVWNAAQEKINRARYLVVVGFSFSEADAYLTKIISRSLGKNKSQQMIICDPRRDLVPALRKRFTAHVEGFDAQRILAARGSAEEVVPMVLDQLVDDRDAGGKVKRSSKPTVAEAEVTTGG